MMAQPKALHPTMTGAEENRHYLRVFIHTYRDLPVLWDTSLRDYTNRDKRAEAYEQLVPIYRYLKRDATIEDVKKKINTLRTNYRKELKVVESARRAGSLHQPRCWTFHELDFLRNTEKFLAVNPNVRGDHFVFNENSQTQASFMDINSAYNFKAILSQTSPLHSPPPNISEMFQKSFGHPTQKFEPHQNSISLPPPPPTHPSSSSSTSNQQTHTNANENYSSSSSAITTEQQNGIIDSPVVIKRQRLSPSTNNASITTNQTTTNGHSSEELLNIARDYLSSSYPEEETISRTWAHKLKRLHREQRLLAEKFINDVLFEAESGTLHRGSVQINAFEPYVRYEEHSNENSSEQIKSQSPIVQSSTSSTSATLESSPDVKVNNMPAVTTPTPSTTTQVSMLAATTSTTQVVGSANARSEDNNYSNYS